MTDRRITVQLPPDEDGHPIGRWELDSYSVGIYLEVVDESVFSGDPIKAAIFLTADQARAMSKALKKAAIRVESE